MADDRGCIICGGHRAVGCEMEDGSFTDLCRRCMDRLPWTYHCVINAEPVQLDSFKSVENYAHRHMRLCSECRDLVEVDPREFSRSLVSPVVTHDAIEKERARQRARHDKFNQRMIERRREVE